GRGGTRSAHYNRCMTGETAPPRTSDDAADVADAAVNDAAVATDAAGANTDAAVNGVPVRTGDAAAQPEPPKRQAGASPSRRVRARLARRMTTTRSQVRPVLEPPPTLHRQVYPKADVVLLQQAYDIAEQRHQGQFRKSGDPYITHPLAVATILADLGMDTTTLVAALLHDTVEDTGYSLEALESEFGSEVAHL